MRNKLLSLLLAAGALAAPVASHAHVELSALSALSALPVASVVGTASIAAGAVVAVPVALSTAGAVLVVKAVESTARGTVYVLERASDGARASIEVAGRGVAGSAFAAGTVVTVSVIGTGVPHLGRPNHGPYLAELRQVMANCAGIRRIGCAAIDLAYVAAGKLDGFWEHGLNPWDTAAGWLLVKEAGGFVTDIDGKDRIHESRSIVAGNEEIHRQLLEALHKGRA